MYIHSTLSTVRNKCAVCNSTKRSIGECPNNISGHFHCITVGIDCFCAKGVSGLGSKDIVICFYVDNVEFTCRSNVGCNEDTVSGRSLCAVTRNRTHLKVLFANTLGKECRRSATVTVCSPLTTESKHYFAFLIGRKTNRVVSTTTVIHTNNKSAVFLNTDHRTSSIVRTTALFGVYKRTILNNHTEGNTNSMEKSAICKVLFNFSLVVRLNVTGNIAFCILEYIEDGGCSVQNCTTGSYILMRITYPLTVVNKYTGRVGVVVKVGVHTTYNVVSKIILVVLSHFGKFLVRPVSLILKILVDLVVSGNNGYIGVRRVNFNNVKNLSAGTSCIVKYDFRLNSSTGNEYVIFLRDYIVVTVCAKACAVENNIVLFPVGNSSKCSHRKYTHEHYSSNDKGYYALRCFSHNFFPFC